MSTSQRFFENDFLDYKVDSQTNFVTENGTLDRSFRSELLESIKNWTNYFELQRKNAPERDSSVYTGDTGFALLYLNMALKLDPLEKNTYLEKGIDLVMASLSQLRGKRISFTCGDAGPYAVGAVIFHHLGKKGQSVDYVSRLLSMCSLVTENFNHPDEILYGAAGYLYALLFVQRHIGENAGITTAIEKVHQRIITSGRNFVASEKFGSAKLMYEWHGRKYMGAAHGLAGILYLLFAENNLSEEYKCDLSDFVQPTLDCMITLRFPSGNYPSSAGRERDELVHWCHGAPGWISTFLAAYSSLKDSKYLREAESCGEVVWKRGLLRKGHSLCHGVAGNAYGFLALYQATNEPRWLHRACCFARWLAKPGINVEHPPDTPWSLFEGAAGPLHFLIDLLHPATARFPAFHL